MHIVKIVEVRLRYSAEGALTYKAYKSTEGWLKTWTPKANFKAVIGADFAEALDGCRQDLRQELVPNWLGSAGVRPEHFEFRVSDQEVKDNRFWPDSACSRAAWFRIDKED